MKNGIQRQYHAFYRCQRKGNIILFLMCLLGVLFAVMFIGLSLIMALTSDNVFSMPFGNYLFALFSVLSTGAYFLLLQYLFRPRKRAYDRYKALLNVEKSEIDVEVKTVFNQIYFGANRLYFKSGLFVDSLKYDDIAWVHNVNVVVASSVPLGLEGTALNSTFALPGLVLYDRKGIRYQSPEKLHGGLTNDDIDKLKEKAPNVIIGFSKARLKLAKKDFDEFLTRGQKLQ